MWLLLVPMVSLVRDVAIVLHQVCYVVLRCVDVVGVCCVSAALVLRWCCGWCCSWCCYEAAAMVLHYVCFVLMLQLCCVCVCLDGCGVRGFRVLLFWYSVVAAVCDGVVVVAVDAAITALMLYASVLCCRVRSVVCSPVSDGDVCGNLM